MHRVLVLLISAPSHPVSHFHNTDITVGRYRTGPGACCHTGYWKVTCALRSFGYVSLKTLPFACQACIISTPCQCTLFKGEKVPLPSGFVTVTSGKMECTCLRCTGKSANCLQFAVQGNWSLTCWLSLSCFQGHGHRELPPVELGGTQRP